MRSIAKLQVILFVIILAASTSVFAKQTVSIIADANLPSPAKYGGIKLAEAMIQKGLAVDEIKSFKNPDTDFVIVAGLADKQGIAAKMLKDLKVTLPQEAESLVVRNTKIDGKPAIILCGSDAVGLMYAALDTADRIGWSTDPAKPFEFVKDISESPSVKDRAVSWYTMNRGYFESRLFDEAYLTSYFDMLAKNRFDHIMLILGYNNECYTMPLFTAPPYPYFFDVEKFPKVKYGQLTSDDQKRHIAAIKKMIQIAHDRGIKFGIGIWDHVPDPGVAMAKKKIDPKNIPADVITGITKANINDYTRVAFTKFLQTFPEIDSLQFRLHWESGLKKEQQGDFSHVLFEVIKAQRPDIQVDIRPKDVPDSILQDALDMGLHLRVTTKYWMEQMGMPFHPTHINPQNQDDRRHGYADLLQYPQKYKIQFRLWNGGTNRVLLWGDPEYARRFSDSVKIYDGDSFEINDSLILKMNGQPHDAKPFELLNPADKYYDYEFQRYWHFYQAFGRVGYNPNCDPAIWEHEFTTRFGKASKPLMNGLHQASNVLPRIIATSIPYSYFPTPKGWAEMRTMGPLTEYAEKTVGGDIEQFMNPADAAKYIIEGTDSPKRWPQQTSRWFARTSQEILANVTLAENSRGNDNNKEFKSTVTDLKILAYLAQYHSKRLMGGVCYNLFKESGDLFALDDAIEYEQQALAAWEQIVASAGDVYNFDMLMGNEKAGTKKHWRQWLPSLKESLSDLKKQREDYQPNVTSDKPLLAHVPVRKLGDSELVIRATAAATEKIQNAIVWIAVAKGDYKAVPMKVSGKWQYEAIIPHVAITNYLKYYIELKLADSNSVTFPENSKAEPIVVMAGDYDPPTVTHEKIVSAKANKDLKITAQVKDPSGVKWVRLRYRHLTQVEDYQTLDMKLVKRSGLYSAVIPADFIIPKWDMMYFIEVMDNKDNGCIYPDLENQTPYIVVPLKR